jgi:hypothetical protein
MRKRTWKSTTFWATLWAAAILTLIVVHTLATSETMQPGAAGILQAVSGLCVAIILAYVGGGKIIDVKHGPEMEGPIDRKSTT